MWEGLIILGLAALGAVTAITLKALDFAQALTKEDGLEEGATLLDARADDVETRGRHRLAERDRAAAAELRQRAADRAMQLEAGADKLDQEADRDEVRGYLLISASAKEKARELRRRAAKLRES